MVPLTPLLSSIGVILEPEQIVCDAGVLTAVGLGFTSTVAVIGVPEQVVDVGVIVNVTVTGAVVVFVKVPLMSVSDDPLAAIPVTEAVLSLVQL